MKDLHCHLLYGIDDGSRSLDESIHLLKQMSLSGITEVILTPHYIGKSKYIANNKDKNKLLTELKKRVAKEKLNIKLYLGNEIYLDEDILSNIKKNEISSLNDSKYLLIELPVLNCPHNVKNIFSELKYNGYKVILAHPERYQYVIENINILKDFIDMGVLLQGNYTSLLGKYGKDSKKALIRILKKGWISFLSGDIHHEITCDEEKIRKKLRWYIKNEDIDRLLNKNFDLIVKNEDV